MRDHLLTAFPCRFGISKTAALIKSKLPKSTQTTSWTGQYSLQPLRVYAQNQPIHPIAYLKQSRSSNQNRWFSSTTRAFTSSAKPARVKYDRSKFPVSKISKAISRRGAAPFASTLRPNLTGGALPRSFGGYGLSGASVRHFSHAPGAQAQVVQNVSAGVRAFFVGGGKARFDGIDPVTKEKRFRSVSQTEDAVYTHWESPMAASARGTNLEFKLSPTVTALSPSFSSSICQESKVELTSLNDINLLDNLATDFARALKDLAAILSDLRLLSAFGDLPISLTSTESGPILRVRFPGCDADLVSRLCDEVGVRRGSIVEDEAWIVEKDVETALLFPFAPTGADGTTSEYDDDGGYYFSKKPLPPPLQPEQLDWRHMLSPSAHTPSQASSLHSYATLLSPPQKPSPHSPSGYESLRESDFASDDPFCDDQSPLRAPTHSTTNSAADYEGLEGIYKFLQVCEEVRR